MNPTTIDLGDLAEAEVAFADKDGAGANPDTVTFTVTSPLGTVTEFTSANDAVTNPAVGTFLLTWLPDKRGRWRVDCLGTGAVQQAVVGWVDVT